MNSLCSCLLALTQTLNNEQQLCENIHVFKDGERILPKFFVYSSGPQTVVPKSRGTLNASWY
jgi:hypothetical protein